MKVRNTPKNMVRHLVLVQNTWKQRQRLATYGPTPSRNAHLRCTWSDHGPRNGANTFSTPVRTPVRHLAGPSVAVERAHPTNGSEHREDGVSDPPGFRFA